MGGTHMRVFITATAQIGRQKMTQAFTMPSEPWRGKKMSDTVGSKQRLRRRKGQITTTLTRQHYRVDPFESGPFHLLARRGKTARAIRICFVNTTTEDILSVRREPVPARCLREIWQISEDGRITVKVKIS
jgi:hypothetical protein